MIYGQDIGEIWAYNGYSPNVSDRYDSYIVLRRVRGIVVISKFSTFQILPNLGPIEFFPRGGGSCH